MTNVGVVGLGMGRWHLQQYQKLPGVRVAAICDTDKERLKRAADEFAVPHVFADYRKMAAMKKLDAVSIALPNYLHMPVTIEMLDAGKDVLVEKPMARTFAEAGKMAGRARTKKRVLMVNMNHRWRPAFFTLKEFAESARFGDIYHLRARWMRRRTFANEHKKSIWFAQKNKSGGGTLIDIGVHMLDLALWILDDFEPVSVSAAVYNKFYEQVDDMASVMLRFENGATVHLETSWEAHVRNDWSISILGTRAGGETEGDSHVRVYQEENGLPSETVFDLPAEFPAEKTSVGHFLTAVRERRTPEPSAEKGACLVRILEAIYLSARENKQIELRCADRRR